MPEPEQNHEQRHCAGSCCSSGRPSCAIHPTLKPRHRRRRECRQRRLQHLNICISWFTGNHLIIGLHSCLKIGAWRREPAIFEMMSADGVVDAVRHRNDIRLALLTGMLKQRADRVYSSLKTQWVVSADTLWYPECTGLQGRHKTEPGNGERRPCLAA